MTVNSVITNGKEIFRILQIDNDQYFVMDCYDFECYSEGDTTSDDYVSGIWVPLRLKQLRKIKNIHK